jgi:hypothetical protein
MKEKTKRVAKEGQNGTKNKKTISENNILVEIRAPKTPRIGHYYA